MTDPRTLATGLTYGESPRWHDDLLWVSDMGANRLLTVDLSGTVEVAAEVPGMPMGSGWLPDGRMLLVSSTDGRLLAREPDGTTSTFADLSALSGFPWGDAVVDGRGNTYVGNIGFMFGMGEPGPGTLALVTPDGVARELAGDFAFPNGIAVTPDNATLIIAESYAGRLTAFDIAPDGGLSGRRTWADLGEAAPDGICLDAEGAIWYADVPNQRCVRVREGGEVLRTVDLDRGAFACALGGPAGTTLFITAARFAGPESMGGEPTGQILAIEVEVPGAGWP
jgi:sugar lactone lactonase YvrE